LGQLDEIPFKGIKKSLYDGIIRRRHVGAEAFDLIARRAGVAVSRVKTLEGGFRTSEELDLYDTMPVPVGKYAVNPISAYRCADGCGASLIVADMQVDDKFFSVPMPAVSTNPDNFTVPAGKRWSIDGAWFSYTTSAVVNNRYVRMEIYNASGGLVWWFYNMGVQTASLTVNYNWAQSDRQAITGTYRSAGIPWFNMTAGWYVRWYATALQVGDQFSQINVMVRETDAYA